MNKKIFYLSKEDNFPQVDPDFFIGMPTDGGLYPALEEVVELAQEGDLVFMVFSGLLPTADDLSAWSEKLSDFDLISISSKEKCSFPRFFMPLPGLTGGSPHIVGFRVSLLEDYFSCTKTLPLKPRENTGLPLVVRLIFFKARVFSIMLETEISSPRGIGPAKLLSLIFSRRRHLRLSPYRSILHIVNIPWYSGLAAYAFDMSRQMKEMGIKTAFAASASSPLEKAVSDKEVFIPLLSRKGLGAFGSAFRISRLAKYYDFVAAHTGSSLFIALMAFRRPKRIIRLRAEGGSIKNNFFNLFLHRRLLKVIVPNKFTASFIPLEPEKMFLLRPLVDTELFSFSELPKENIIGIAGRLDRVKGHYELISALPKIRENIPDIKLHIIGSEANISRKDLEEKALEEGVVETLVFKDCNSYSEMPLLMRQCRLGIAPSISSEAVSRVVLEWFSSGRPVVAGDAGSLPELMGESESGYYLDASDSFLLAERVVELLKDKDKLALLGEKARLFVEDNFSPDAYGACLGSFIEDYLKK